jgi:hypothetical protein
MENILLLFLAGAGGALLKEILADNCLTLPSLKDGVLNLGFLGGIVIGAFAGYAIDGSYVTAAMGGFSGTAVIQALVQKKTLGENSQDETIEELIRRISGEEMVDSDLAVAVAKCESSLNPAAVHANTDGSRDRGLFQINEKYHPEVTADQAFDAEFSTRWFCKAFKAGNLSWWNSSKKCWDKTA